MSFLHQLNPRQRDAVKALDGPTMILAGAGSGKTRVLTYRVAHLLESGIRPESILALTFTNKAASEMKERIVSLVGERSRQVWMGTFHSLFARILRIEAERIGYRRNYTIYDTDDSLSSVKHVMAGLNISAQQYTPQNIRARISMAKNQLVDPNSLNGADPASRVTAAVFEGYEQRLRSANAMDFDDLLVRPLELFTKHRDVLERYQRKFAYILVDEYQDTNRVQYRLIQELARSHGNICVVGDDAQSIYAFRGADIRNILDFERDYPGCKVFRLEQNYRSTKTILAAADSLIKHNTGQLSKNLWTDNPEGERIVVEGCDDDREEGRTIVTRITQEVTHRKLSLNDIAVLYRTNAQSRSIEDALRRAGIPYVIIGGVAFYRRKEIKDVLAYLKLLANPRDAESFLRIVNIPARGIGATSLGRLDGFAKERGISLLEAASSAEGIPELGDRPAKALKGFAAMLQKYIGIQESIGAPELVRGIIEESGLLSALQQEGTAEALARRDNIQELVSAISEFSEIRSDGTLEHFLEEVSLVADVDTADFSRNAVTLMTLHAAKGLEFPVVVIAGLETGLLPLGGAEDESRELEEERRLMYVGITRAKEMLYLTYARIRFRFGESTATTPSVFLNEIEPSLLDLHRQVPRAIQHPEPGSTAREEYGNGKIGRIRRGRSAEEYSDHMPDYEHESQISPSLHVGSRVHHEAFGRGRVIALEGRGEETRAVVEFEEFGRKHLMLKFAQLRLQ